MKLLRVPLIFLLLLGARLGECAQFSNLDFEQGDTTKQVIDTFPDGRSVGPIWYWLPGWKVLRGNSGGDGQNSISLNAGLAGPNINTLYDVNYVWNIPRDGQLAFLASRSLPSVTTSLEQAGQIPADARSLHYNAHGGPWEVRVNGMKLDLHGWDDNDQSLNFQDVGVDISPWAGEEVELRFTQTADYRFCAIDSIRFSTELIPEPENGAVLFLGGGILSLLSGARAVVGSRRRR